MRKRTSRAIARFGVALVASLAASVSAQQTDHTFTTDVIQTGLEVYVRQCAVCHGPDGRWVDGIDLARGEFRSAVSDADVRAVITNGAAEGQMPAFRLNAAELDGLIAYMRTGFDPDISDVVIGDPTRGEALFQGKGACADCHRVDGHGPRAAPDLSSIGTERDAAALQKSLRSPAAALLPINRPVAIVTRDEETIRGRRLNEDTWTVQLIDSNGRLRSLVKAELASYQVSDRPTHEPTTLAADEIADLVAYLMTLRR